VPSGREGLGFRSSQGYDLLLGEELAPGAERGCEIVRQGELAAGGLHALALFGRAGEGANGVGGSGRFVACEAESDSGVGDFLKKGASARADEEQGAGDGGDAVKFAGKHVGLAAGF